ncbi:MAG: hypothetical protein ACLUDF_03020 [Butyricicoccus sp.]
MIHVQPAIRCTALHSCTVFLPFLIQQNSCTSRTGTPGRPSLFRSRKRRTSSAAATRLAALPRRTAQP